MSKGWNNPIHAILKELRNKDGLTWLRISMSYHKFSNLREIFQGDLNRKLMDGIGISGLYGSTLQLQPCIKDRWEMCLQWRVKENVCSIQSNLQSMPRVLHWTNTTKSEGSNGPASQWRQKANHKRHQIWLIRKPLRKSLQERNKTNKWW
jgi:hypothetical protein